MNDSAQRDFDAAYAAWRRRVDRDMSLSFSSIASDYTDLPEYQDILKLGQAGLPGVMSKLEDGEWILNNAAFAMAGIRYDDVVPDPDELYSELDISKFLLDWWRGQQQGAQSDQP